MFCLAHNGLLEGPREVGAACLRSVSLLEHTLQLVQNRQANKTVFALNSISQGPVVARVGISPPFSPSGVGKGSVSLLWLSCVHSSSAVVLVASLGVQVGHH